MRIGIGIAIVMSAAVGGVGWMLILANFSANWGPAVYVRDQIYSYYSANREEGEVNNWLGRLLFPNSIMVKGRYKGTAEYVYQLNGRYVNSYYKEGRFVAEIRDDNNMDYLVEIPIHNKSEYPGIPMISVGEKRVGESDFGQNEYLILPSMIEDTLRLVSGGDIKIISVYWRDSAKLSELLKKLNMSRLGETSELVVIRSNLVVLLREN